MRSLNLKSMASFITGEHTLDISNIRSLFIALHEKQLELHPAWNLKATRKLIIANYWFREVLMHFATVIAVAAIFTLNQCNSWLAIPASILFASIPALFSLTAFVYFPSFVWKFLPNLEVITGEQEKLAMQACRLPQTLDRKLNAQKSGDNISHRRASKSNLSAQKDVIYFNVTGRGKKYYF